MRECTDSRKCTEVKEGMGGGTGGGREEGGGLTNSVLFSSSS
jgi:hypothetical protein